MIKYTSYLIIGYELEDQKKRLEKLIEHVRLLERDRDEQQKKFHDLKGGMVCSKDQINELQQEFEEITLQLGDARIDKQEDVRRKKKQEIIQDLKGIFPGVYDRLINMTQPIHKKYNVAITKRFGRYIDGIVVDSGMKINHSILFQTLIFKKQESYIFLIFCPI